MYDQFYIFYLTIIWHMTATRLCYLISISVQVMVNLLYGYYCTLKGVSLHLSYLFKNLGIQIIVMFQFYISLLIMYVSNFIYVTCSTLTVIWGAYFLEEGATVAEW